MGLDLAEPAYRIEERVVLEEPVSTFALDRGWAFRVDQEGRPVGVVFVADGRWDVRFERPADARAAANRLAVLEKVPVAELAGVAAGAPLALDVDRGLVLGNAVWDEVAPALRATRADTDDMVVFPAPDAAEEVVVTGDRGEGAARRIAERVLEERVGWMREHAFDPAALLAADRVQAEDLRTLVAEFRTDRAWDRFAGDTEVEPDQHWLLYVRDPSGAFDREARALVLAQALLDEEALVRRTVARERFPAGPDGVPRAPHRVDLAGAASTVIFDREATGFALIGRTVADLRVTAVGGPARVVWLDVPHVEQQAFAGNPPLAEGWTLDRVTTLDGVPLDGMHLPLSGGQEDGRGRTRTVAVVLPDDVPAGGTAELRVTWTDRHRYVHTSDRWNGDPVHPQFRVDDLGTTTGLLPALPRLRTNAAPPVPAAVRVGIRPWHAERDEVAMSGVREETWRDGAYEWTRSTTVTAAPTVAVGRWKEAVEPVRMAFPAVRILTRTQGTAIREGMAAHVRALLAGWGELLPPYPAREVGVTELFMYGDRLQIVVAGDGAVGLHPLRHRTGWVSAEPSIRRRYPHFEVWALATMLHSHWWIAADGPGGGDLRRSLAAVYGAKTVGALYGEEDEDVWFDRFRELATPADRGGDGWPAEAFVLGRTVAAAFGDAVLFEAVDRTLSGEFPPTLEGLEAALAASSGRDPAPLFDAWIRAGLAPQVDVTWSRVADGVRIEATSDVPFGRLGVPVRIVGPDGSSDATVELTDGRGAIVVPWEGEVRGVRTDPDGLLLLATRR